MGVHDFMCCVCGEPQAYECHEAEPDGPPCSIPGIGEDKAFLTFFFFPESAVPESIGTFLERHSEARAESYAFGYDWGDWEFKPSLNYRDQLMADDPHGIWRLPPHSVHGESPVEVDVPEGEAAWILNACPLCWDRFVLGKPGVTCQLYEKEIRSHLGVEGDALVEEVRKKLPLPPAGVDVRDPVRVERPDFDEHQEKLRAEYSKRVEEKEASKLILPGDPNGSTKHGDFDDRRPGGFQRF